MANGLSRRNGKAASCEPCRKAKIRCDHGKPCSRCRQRGSGTKCVYHPAPLTRPREQRPGHIVGFSSFQTSSFPLGEDPEEPAGSRYVPSIHAVSPPISIQHRLPLRMTWRSGGLHALRRGEQLDTLAPNFNGDSPASATTPARDPALNNDVESVKYILAMLQHFDFLDHLIQEYAVHAQAILVPSPLIKAICSALRVTAASLTAEDYEDQHGRLTAMAKLIIANTSSPMRYPADLDVATFVALYTGDNLRLETLGLIYSIAVRAFLLGLTGDDHKREDFVQTMCNSSYTCLCLCRKLCKEVNEMQAFLCFEDHRRTSVTEGDATPSVWRKLGESIADLYLSGIHREANNARLPFFLAECRRKVFAHLFRSDKFISSVMELAPRMLRIYCDCRLPLNLTDDQLIGAANEAEARRTLTPSGWNIDNEWMPTTWTRVRFILAEMQEEILGEIHSPQDATKSARLHELLDRSYKRWDSLPKHTHYNPECWNGGISMPICLMLSTVRQAFLQAILQIYSALEPIEPEVVTARLSVAMEVLITLHDVGRNLNRAIFLRYDFPYEVLCYGLPAAALVVNAIADQARNKNATALPPGLSRSFVIRQVSVFISHLESIFNPGDPNYEICNNTAKAISRTLDDALDLPTQSSSIGPQTPASSDQATGAMTSANMPLMLNNERGGMDLDFMSSSGLDGFDFATWMKDIDWTGTGGEWSNL